MASGEGGVRARRENAMRGLVIAVLVVAVAVLGSDIEKRVPPPPRVCTEDTVATACGTGAWRCVDGECECGCDLLGADRCRECSALVDPQTQRCTIRRGALQSDGSECERAVLVNHQITFSAGHCISNGVHAECVECARNSDCPSGLFCDEELHKCVHDGHDCTRTELCKCAAGYDNCTKCRCSYHGGVCVGHILFHSHSHFHSDDDGDDETCMFGSGMRVPVRDVGCVALLTDNECWHSQFDSEQNGEAAKRHAVDVHEYGHAGAIYARSDEISGTLMGAILAVRGCDRSHDDDDDDHHHHHSQGRESGQAPLCEALGDCDGNPCTLEMVLENSAAVCVPTWHNASDGTACPLGVCMDGVCQRVAGSDVQVLGPMFDSDHELRGEAPAGTRHGEWSTSTSQVSTRPGMIEAGSLLSGAVLHGQLETRDERVECDIILHYDDNGQPDVRTLISDIPVSYKRIVVDTERSLVEITATCTSSTEYGAIGVVIKDARSCAHDNECGDSGLCSGGTCVFEVTSHPLTIDYIKSADQGADSSACLVACLPCLLGPNGHADQLSHGNYVRAAAALSIGAPECAACGACMFRQQYRHDVLESFRNSSAINPCHDHNDCTQDICLDESVFEQSPDARSPRVESLDTSASFEQKFVSWREQRKEQPHGTKGKGAVVPKFAFPAHQSGLKTTCSKCLNFPIGAGPASFRGGCLVKQCIAPGMESPEEDSISVLDDGQLCPTASESRNAFSMLRRCHKSFCKNTGVAAW